MRLISPVFTAVVLAMSVWSVCSFSADEDQHLPNTSQNTNASPETTKSEPPSDEPHGEIEKTAQNDQPSLADSEEQLATLKKERIKKLESLVATSKARIHRSLDRNPKTLRNVLEAEQQLLDAKLSSEAVAADRIRLIEESLKTSAEYARTMRQRGPADEAESGLFGEISTLNLQIRLVEQKMLEAEERKPGPTGNSDLNTASANMKTQPQGGSNVDPELRDLLQQRRDILRQQVAASRARAQRDVQNFNDHLSILKSLVDVELELAMSIPERQQACERYVEETEFLLGRVESRVGAGFGSSDSVNSLKAAVLDAKILRARHKSKPPQQ